MLCVEVLRKRPRINILNPKIEELVERLDIEFDLSISHIKENAIAMVVVKVNKEG